MALKWKVLHYDENDGTIRSNHDFSTWRIGEWRETGGAVDVCVNGFHASPRILDAMKYVEGNCIALVETGGDCAEEEDDKSAHRRMRIVKAYRLTRRFAVALAAWAAERAIGNFEAEYPWDDRPRRGLQLAQRWLAGGTISEADALAAAFDIDRALPEMRYQRAFWAACAVKRAAAALCEGLYPGMGILGTTHGGLAVTSHANMAIRYAVSSGGLEEDEAEAWLQGHVAAMEEVTQ